MGNIAALLILLVATVAAGPASAETELQKQNEQLLQQLEDVHHLTVAQMSRVWEIFANSPYIGQVTPPSPGTR